MADIALSIVTDPREKQRTARRVLEDLTDWFAIEPNREKYIRESADKDFFAAFSGDEPAGFLCLRQTSPCAKEIWVMGVRRSFHRRGIGRALFLAAKEHALSTGTRFLHVKTVREGTWEEYDRTNLFYRSVGFEPLEVLEELWGPDDPCQVYVMPLCGADSAIFRRHSYRGRYRPDPVPREHLAAILRAGLDAPSGCNKQTTSLVAVDDPALLGALRAVVDPPVGETAPAVIFVLTQRTAAYRDRCFSVQDYSAAIENMLLMITYLGYSSCWYEGHITDEDRICDRLAEILGVPEGYDLVCMLPVGKADGECAQPAKRPFEERAWFNGFGGEARQTYRKEREDTV